MKYLFSHDGHCPATSVSRQCADAALDFDGTLATYRSSTTACANAHFNGT